MRTLFTLVFCFVLLEGTLAQKNAPYWMDPYQREAKFPANEYLVGMSSELVPKNHSLAEVYKQLNQLSRNQLIESVHVDVRSETEMNISIVNTEATQLLDQNSVSIAEMELVGLKFENYYNKKKKTATSFSYVRIQDVIDYNLDVIRLNTEAIKKLLTLANGSISNGNKQEAIDLLFESQRKLKEINQSAVIIMALGQDDLLDFDSIGQMKLDIAQGTNDFFTKGSLTVEDLASFYAYALQLQLGNAPLSICKGKVGYQNSQKQSRFSAAINNRVVDKLADLEQVSIGESNCDFTFEGNFSLSNDAIVLVTNLADVNGKARVAINKKFPFNVMEFGNLTFLPENFEFIEDLSKIMMRPEQPAYDIKKVELFKNPIRVAATLSGDSLVDVPVRYSISKDERVLFETSIATDKSGISELVLNNDQLAGSGEYIVDARIDVATFLDVHKDGDFVKTLLLEYPLQTKQLKVEVLAPTVFVASNETSFGEPLNIDILAPSVKNALVPLDYLFVESAEEADFVIHIEATTREGQANQYAYFAYLDATVSMVRTDTGKEMYKNSLTSVKGAGANFNLAGAKAYEKAKTTIGNDLSYKLEFGK